MPTLNLLAEDLCPHLKHNIIRAHHAKVTPKAIAKYLGLPLAQVKQIIAEDQQRQVELAQWQAVIGEQLLADEP